MKKSLVLTVESWRSGHGCGIACDVEERGEIFTVVWIGGDVFFSSCFSKAVSIRYLPSGIDIYFDNVGGAMLEAALLNMRPHGRIAVCGVVSQQGISDTEGIHNLFCLVTKRIRMQGFLQSDCRHLFPQFLDCMANYYEQGKIVYIEDMSEGLDSAPGALVGLCTGKNVGKQVVCISRERLVSY